MSSTAAAILLSALTLTLSACDSGSTPVEPESSRTTAASVLLTVDDLPDGYATSPPQAQPEVSAVGSVSVAGCDVLLNRFRDGGSGVRFEAGTSGPFLAEELADDAGAAGVLRELAGRCAAFTDTDAGGETTGVTVAEGGLPSLGDESAAFLMTASGGVGDDAYTLGGYLIAVRVGGTTCTIVHFGQPGVDPAETEAIARAAVRKLQRRQ
ncbi:hypothetical protein [Dactylosporangium siamense]|uniref:Lipoprotein n=2 Tax=Dactylosporangium siamense TaxID=685454 RepID=A0A919PMB7_9ACTN|nr:hypothetical protein [Dactylosporangium siamense]GIG46589.1 hypothetical protein Dsi01nite_046300 [Dactylosporangium siamense]